MKQKVSAHKAGTFLLLLRISKIQEVINLLSKSKHANNNYHRKLKLTPTVKTLYIQYSQEGGTILSCRVVPVSAGFKIFCLMNP